MHSNRLYHTRERSRRPWPRWAQCRRRRSRRGRRRPTRLPSAWPWPSRRGAGQRCRSGGRARQSRRAVLRPARRTRSGRGGTGWSSVLPGAGAVLVHEAVHWGGERVLAAGEGGACGDERPADAGDGVFERHTGSVQLLEVLDPGIGPGAGPVPDKTTTQPLNTVCTCFI